MLATVSIPGVRFTAGWLVLFVLFLSLTGCGDGVQRPQIKGKVSYRGKSVGNKTLFLKFVAPPEESFTQMLPLSKEGTFAGEVAKPGSYKVVMAESLAAMDAKAIAINDGPVNEAPMNLGNQGTFPAKYKDASTSDLTLTIESGQNTLNIELTD